jgi:hypothetical protein
VVVGFNKISPPTVPVSFPTVKVADGEVLPMPTGPPLGFKTKL